MKADGCLVLVTGAAGFAGSHLVEHLAATERVVGWLGSSPPPADVTHLADWQHVDLLDRDRVRAALADLRPAAIYHCAGLPHVAESWNDRAQPLRGNVMTTHHLLAAMRDTGVRCRILITGSAAVYAASSEPIRESHAVAPTSPYGISKLAQEQLALHTWRDEGIDVVLTRSFNHTGARQTAAFVAPSVARQIAHIEAGLQEPNVRVGNLDATRDLTDVRDVVRAYAALMARGATATIYNVASGVGHSIRAVVDALIARARVPLRVDLDPTRMRPSDVPVVVGDPSLLRDTTGWQPTISFDKMLDDLLGYWRAHAV